MEYQLLPPFFDGFQNCMKGMLLNVGIGIKITVIQRKYWQSYFHSLEVQLSINFCCPLPKVDGKHNIHVLPVAASFFLMHL
jgi:hypothetical protein